MLKLEDKVCSDCTPRAIYTISSIDEKFVCLEEFGSCKKFDINCLTLLCEDCQAIPVYPQRESRKCLFCAKKEAARLLNEFVATLTEKQLSLFREIKK